MKLYPAGIASEAAGMPPATMQRCLQRNHITMQPCDKPSRGCGENRGYSTRRINQMALTVELTALGISPSRAAKAAYEFSDRGSPGRNVGEPHPLGTTLLVGLPRGENRVIQVPPDKTIQDVLASDTAAFIIDAGKVVAKVKETLDTH
jgi:hypothetical protein